MDSLLNIFEKTWQKEADIALKNVIIIHKLNKTRRSRMHTAGHCAHVRRFTLRFQ